MSRIIIGIHGLRNKPPKRVLKRWWKRSIKDGLKREGMRWPVFRFRLVYWADILYPKPLKRSIQDEDDPRFLEAPYLPPSEKPAKRPGRMRRRILDAVEKQLDKLFLKENSRIDFHGISDKIIKRYFEDLDAYYCKKQRGRDGSTRPLKDIIRRRLAERLKRHGKEEILLIGHSMGSIIAFDVLTQIAPDIPIHTFITIGSPLGIPTVIRKAQLDLGLAEQKPATPESVINAWYNFTDLEDRVAFNYNLADDYTPNSRGIRPIDREVWNDYHRQGERNPHKSYGYLRTPEISRIMKAFLGASPKPNSDSQAQEKSRIP